MPALSRKTSLLRALRNAASSPELLDQFLTDLLTSKEYDELAARWEIVQRLANGEPQRTIAEEVGVGIATVTRGAKELQDMRGGFRRVLNRI